MERIILVRYGEIALKGLNRSYFENKLISNIKKSLYGIGEIKVTSSQSRIYIEPAKQDYDLDLAVIRVRRVFGVVSVSVVWKIPSEFEVIREKALEMLGQLRETRAVRTFKVETKRGNKRFPMDSPEISREVGAFILENIPDIQVDVHKPDTVIFIEVRESSYIYSEILPASGGMPLGTNGKASLLLSGGIDSPVAGWMIAKRGVEIDAVHFYSYPYTSERAKDKVIRLCRILARYCGEIRLHVVPFTDIQLAMNERCPEEQLTIIMRRVMMRISERIARENGSLALITGESIGQVASQTLQSLAVTNQAAGMPVFRPLIGMDKNEIVEIARKIDTFETSILPYEDCCTVFVPKHPKTKPVLEKILLSEAKLDADELIEEAIKNVEVLQIKEERS